MRTGLMALAAAAAFLTGIGGAPRTTSAEAVAARTATVAPVARTISLLSASGEFRLVAGDAEFGGNGPDVSLSVTLRVSSDGRQVLAALEGTASEVGGTTRARIDTAVPVYTAEPGAVITAVLSPATAVLSYRDGDHDGDYVCEGAGELPFKDRLVTFRNAAGSPCKDGLVRLARFLGDVNGADVNTGTPFSRVTRTSVDVLFAPIRIAVRPGPAPQLPVALAVPYAGTPQENFSGNNCGSSAGFRVLNYYGSKITYEQMVDRVRSRFHASNLAGVGIPPGLLKDALNEVSPGFRVVTWAYPADGESAAANRAARTDLRAKLVAALRQKKPLIALLGWGERTATRGVRDGSTVYHGLYSPERDEARIDLLHYVVVRGYNPANDTFEVVDNGMGKTWRADYLLNMMLFDRGPDFHVLINAVAPDVRPATVIYKP